MHRRPLRPISSLSGAPLPERVRATPARARSSAFTLLAVVVLLVAAACTSASPEVVGSKPGTSSAAPGGPAVTTAPTTPPEPDKLADPQIGPGTCKVVMYTPPSAKQALPGELCRPKENQRDTAVMVVHGGSGISGSYEGMRRWANRYLVEGYVTFLPEYHLFNVGGETPVFPRPEQNIKAATQYLRGVGNALGIRKDRIVVQGQSAGARVGAVAFTTPDDPWFAGPELYPGISDAVNGFIGFYHPYDGTMQFADQYFGGNDQSSDPKVAERLAKGDSLANAKNAIGPAFFTVGDDDWNIIILQQDAFAESLRQKSLAATTTVIKGGGHGFDEGGPRLSKLGEEAAAQSLQWLNDNFPQVPGRPAQSADADVNNAPTYSGVPPTTYQPRPAPNGGYGNATKKYTATTAYQGGGNSGGGGMVTTTLPQTPATTLATTTPTTAGPPTTVAPPTTAAPPPTTAAPPPTTMKPPPTTPAPPTTSAPPVTVP